MPLFQNRKLNNFSKRKEDIDFFLFDLNDLFENEKLIENYQPCVE